MKVIVEHIQNSLQANGHAQLNIDVVFTDGNDTILEETTLHFAITNITGFGDIVSGGNSIILTYAEMQSYSLTSDDIIWPYPTVAARSFSNPSLAVNTARQASTTRDAFVSASVDITASLSLTTGQKGTVTLQYADDSGFTTNVKTVQPMTNGNTGTLAIGLALGQMVTATVSGIVPAAKYYRLLTTNVTGTPTFGTPAIQEVLL